VKDTGIGIAPEDQERIFLEFSQLDHPIQKDVKGTGLGLPLSRRLAALLGGSVGVQSEPGVGSTFQLEIPVRHRPIDLEGTAAPPEVDESKIPVLVVEDDSNAVFIYEQFFRGSCFQLLSARTVREARSVLKAVRPAAIMLDILLPGEDAWGFLAEMKGDSDTARIPILVVTDVEDQRKGIALGADAYCVKPVERDWLLEKLMALTRPGLRRVLIVDDDEASRYVLRRQLAGRIVTEARDGIEGLRLAHAQRPQIIFLDLKMPGMSGFEVLEKLKADPETRDIPVVVVTAKVLEAEESSRLLTVAEDIIPKQALTAEAVEGALARLDSQKITSSYRA
jgi:CheY-like chemotaxis protein